jgi:peptidoglycan/LPS O-acetylase OafA/YrhL
VAIALSLRAIGLLPRSAILSTLTTSRIRGFDGLRALAFLLVFISHKAISPLTDRYGTAGVWIFFVLSGFLITRILAQGRGKIEAGRGSFISGLAQFYGRRTARIFPVYYVFLTVVTMLALRDLVEVASPERQASNWFYLSNVYIELNGWQTRLGHLWSLAVEEQFYLLFAPLVLAVPRRQAPIVCLSIVAASIAAHGYLFAKGAWVASFDVNSFVNFGLMAVGGLAGLWAEKRLPRGLQGDGPLALTLGLVLVMPALFTAPESWAHFGRLTCVLNALVLVQIYQLQNGRVTALLDLFPIRELGIISYAAYLFHPVINSAEVLHHYGYSVEIRRSLSMVLDLAATILLAWVSWRILERPVRSRLISRFKPAGCVVAGPRNTE